MVKNKLYTLSYFRKRLIEFGYNVEKHIIQYENETRKWTVIANSINDSARLLITCYKLSPDDYWWKISCKTNDNIKIKTKSMKSFIEMLNDLTKG